MPQASKGARLSIRHVGVRRRDRRREAEKQERPPLVWYAAAELETRWLIIRALHLLSGLAYVQYITSRLLRLVS